MAPSQLCIWGMGDAASWEEGEVKFVAVWTTYKSITKHFETYFLDKHTKNCKCSRVESRKICMSDIACVRRAQDIGFCGMSDTSDIVSGEKQILFFPQNNVRHVRHPTKAIVLGTSDASNVRYAHLPAFHTRAITVFCLFV